MAARAEQQPTPAPKPQPTVRRQWVTLSYDWLRTQPLHFENHPVEDLVGREVGESQRQTFDYESRDGLTRVDVIEFRRPGSGLGLTVYPLGMATGATLGVRVSAEDIPRIELRIEGPALVSSYLLEDARSLDLSMGVYVADRAPGWGLGSHAFVAGGFGRIKSDGLGRGPRYFAEGGGGLNAGPIGVQLAVKIAWNRLDAPVSHSFLTLPIVLRGMVSF
ncbi:MAG: hypothetical protein ACRD09_04005 [Vicinamibacterales bacterium]